MLCKSNKEDTEHFLLICPSLGSNVINRINQDGLLLQLILDSSATKLRHIFKHQHQNRIDIERITRTLCYGLHTRRAALLT